jgi:hypothetical protein
MKPKKEEKKWSKRYLNTRIGTPVNKVSLLSVSIVIPATISSMICSSPYFDSLYFYFHFFKTLEMLFEILSDDLLFSCYSWGERCSPSSLIVVILFMIKRWLPIDSNNQIGEYNISAFYFQWLTNKWCKKLLIQIIVESNIEKEK